MATRGSDIFMRSGTNFIFDTSANVTIPNPIDSELGGTVGGGLTKQGSGKLSLNGDNTYTGTTTVTQGELNINGSVITNVEVQPNGILSGNLSINDGKTLTNNGLISPGNGNIGSMTIEGSFTQGSQGILEIDITPTANDADKVFVITPSIANIDGTLLVNIGSGNYIKGTLYKVIEGQTNISPSLTIQKTGALANLVDIKIIEGSIQLEINNTVIFSHPSLPQGNPLMIIDAFIALDIQENTPLVQIVEALGLLNYPGPLADVLNKMTAANYANLEWMTLTSDTQLSYILGHRAHSLKCAKRGECGTEKNKGIWISSFGNFENTKPFDWLSGYDADAGGALIGFDVCTHPFYFGFGGGYAYTDFHLKQNSGSGDIQSGFGAIYGGFISKYFIADASVIVGGKHFDMHRKVAFLMINETAYAKFNAPFVNAHLGLMGQVHISDFRLELFGNIDYHYLQLGSILETGSSINLFINRHHSHFLKTELGINLKGIFKHGKVCYAPFVGVSGVVKTPLGNTNYGAFFAGNTFYQNTLTSNDSQLLVSPRCGIRIYAAPFIIMIGYKGEFNRYTKDHQVDGSLEWTF
ncbi:MAG: Extracellular serine protease [Chlamydiae bacterium]|nr:Extracellular serine protease [Chlamydiota bacterium]